MLIVIGEAAKQVSSGLKEKHPEIPWKEISGMTKIEFFRACWRTFTSGPLPERNTAWFLISEVSFPG
jgi:hypothetical protein